MISTEQFERWWNQEGSSIAPTAFEDTSEHVKRVSEIAWANGHYIATTSKALTTNCDSSTQADSTSETPRSDAIDSNRADAGSIGAYFMMRDLAWKLERELAQAIKERDEAIEVKEMSQETLAILKKQNGSIPYSSKRKLEQQRATATEALEKLRMAAETRKDTTTAEYISKTLAAIKENRGEQP